MQIVHSLTNHWIVASTIGCSIGNVLVFDSVYSSVDEATMSLIRQLFGVDVKVKQEVTPRQQGSSDCGVFAIAIATSLAFEHIPNSIAFQQNTMIDHLLTCFEKMYLTHFPVM